MSRIPFEMDQEDVDRDYDALFGDALPPEPAPDPHAKVYTAKEAFGDGGLCDVPAFDPNPDPRADQLWRERAEMADPHAAAMAAGLSAVEAALQAEVERLRREDDEMRPIVAPASPGAEGEAVMTHTPGPWRVYGGRCGKDSKDFMVIYGDEDTFSPIICDVKGGEGLPGAANARLIAAAPELADALEKVSVRIARWQAFGIQAGEKGKDSDLPELIAAIAEALRKAGRS